MSARKTLFELLTTGAFRARRHGPLVFAETLPAELPVAFDPDLAPSWERVRNVALRVRGGELTAAEQSRALLELQAEAKAFAEAAPANVSDRALRRASFAMPPRPAAEAMMRGHRAELAAAGVSSADHLLELWWSTWMAWETRHGFQWRGAQLPVVRCRRDQVQPDPRVPGLDRERRPGRRARVVPDPPFATVWEHFAAAPRSGFPRSALVETLELAAVSDPLILLAGGDRLR